MSDKNTNLAQLREMLGRWDALLARLSEAQITAPDLDDGWSIKDVMAHLMAWQQLSVARMQAARVGGAPDFSLWPAEYDPDGDEDLQKINDWVYQHYHGRPWAEIHQGWHAGYQRFIDLTAAVPEADQQAAGKYPWLHGAPLDAVVEGLLEHHAEHYEWISEVFPGGGSR